MARGLSTAITDALANKTIQVYESIYLDIDTGIYVTNAPFNIVADGVNTFVSLGSLLSISEINEERLFTTNELNIQLTGLPKFDDNGDSYITDFLQYDYVDKSVKVYRSFFDKDSYIDSFLLFQGRIDAPTIDDSPSDTSILTVSCSNHWVDYQRSNGVITNDNRQQTLYTGDRGFQYANEIVKDIEWKE
jgi:hypothetical protein